MTQQQHTPSPQPRARLIQARNELHLSQQQVAEQIGTTHVNVSRWERGLTRPGPYFRRKLCKLFHASEYELDLLPIPGEEIEPTTKKPTSLLLPSPDLTAEPAPVSAAASHAIYDSTIPLLPATRKLIGRDDDLTRIRERLRSSTPLAVLNGLPGVGKTALTITLAHDAEIREHFHDGILWAGLGPNPNITAHLSRWGQLLGLSADQTGKLNTLADWATALRGAIGERAMLLVIDDAWSIEAALALKIGGLHCGHLVTTRFPNIAAQLTVDGATTLHELNEEQGIALLRQLAPQAVDIERGKAYDLVQIAGGLPLALTLMGNYLRTQAYSGQVRRVLSALSRLSDARTRLELEEPRGPVETHPSLSTDVPISLQSVIAVTDQFLNDPAASQTLYALSIFPPKPNSFSEEAAIAAANCDFDILDKLNDTGLLESSLSGRYMLHQTIADYARLRLDEKAASGAYTRLIEYMLDFVEQHERDYEQLEQESNTIMTALEAAQRLDRRTELIRGTLAFTPFMHLRAWYAQAETYLHAAYEAACAASSQLDLIDVLLYRGKIAHKQGNFAQAETYLQEGLSLARQLDDKERISALLADLGLLLWKRAEYKRAEVFLLEGLTLARQLQNQERLGELLRALGAITNSQGNYQQSEIYLREGLEAARKANNYEQMLPILVNLGVALGEQGNFLEAKSYFQEGLDVARQIGYREATMVLLGNLGYIASELEKYAQAEIYYQEGLALARSLEQREWMSTTLVDLGEMARKQTHYNQAEEYLNEGLFLARQIGRAEIISSALYRYGEIYLEQSQFEKAKKMFQEALDIAPEGGRHLIAQAYYGLARVARHDKDDREARRLGELSATILNEIHHRKAAEVNAWLASSHSERAAREGEHVHHDQT
jgi:tetratricopeptide (TPR) repeat protein/transcriptional regulator with XRE-family HTH domain